MKTKTIKIPVIGTVDSATGEVRSKQWSALVDILEKNFPKGISKERGSALVMVAMIEFLLLFGEKELRKTFNL